MNKLQYLAKSNPRELKCSKQRNYNITANIQSRPGIEKIKRRAAFARKAEPLQCCSTDSFPTQTDYV